MREVSMIRFAERMQARDRLLEVLVKAQEQRHKRREANGWILYEREQMLCAVNYERARLNEPPVPMASLERAERQALGHSDYSSKFALYCSELAYDGGDR